MAPVSGPDHGLVETQITRIIQDLYEMMVQVTNYDTAGTSTATVLENSFKNLHADLLTLHTQTSNSPAIASTPIPQDIINYVDEGRNPEIYTREFVENTRRDNQLMRGRKEGFRGFRDVLAKEMGKVFPELKGEIEMVVESTGGERGILNGIYTEEAVVKKEEHE